MNAPHTLFVYGTLRRRHPHAMAKFLAERGNFLGEARVAGRLYAFERYPGAVPSDVAGEWVYGDVYELSGATLAELDAYEDVESPQPSYFERQKIAVTVGGETREAWIYWFRGDLPAGARLIANGQYV